MHGAVALALLLALFAVIDAPPGDAPAAGPLSPSERQLTTWAEGRFAAVGLDLPPVDVSFHEDSGPCGGHEGIYRHVGGRHLVLVCITDRGSAASDLLRRRTLLHELAHAWERANLDDPGREALLVLLEADEWLPAGAPWEERGAERFAETIVWGLYDQPRRPVLIDVACSTLATRFEAITGHHPLGTVEGHCVSDGTAERPPAGSAVATGPGVPG